MNGDPAASNLASSAQPAPGEMPAELGELAALARRIAGTPFAAVTITGMGVASSSAEGAVPTIADFLVHTLRSPEPLEIPDAAADPCFNGARHPGVRGYAGWALRGCGGDGIGTLAVYATDALTLDDEQRALLGALARQAVALAELHARVAELEILGGGYAGMRPDAAPMASFVDKLIDSAPVAIYYADNTLDFDWCNPEYRRIFRLKAHQSSKEWAQGIHPDDRARIESTWGEFCEQPRAMTFEYRTRQDDGGVRYFSEKVAPIEGIDGYVGSISDFTDLVNTRADLHKAENLFRNTFDQAPFGIIFVSREGRLERHNRYFRTLLGYSEAELANLSADAVIPSEDVEECAAQIEALWSGKVPFLDTERRYRRKDGVDVWVRSTTALVHDGARADRRVEYLRDVTHRRQLTAELARQRTLLESVIADLPVALIACDVAGNVTHCNRAAAEMRWAFSSSQGAATETHAADVFLADGMTPVAAEDRPLARALRGETITNLELTVVAHDSPPRTTLSSARRLVGAGGETLGAVAVIQDTTERKYQEIELERVHKELITASREAGMAEVATNVLHNVGNILNSVNISASIVSERVRQSKAAGVSRLAELLAEQAGRIGEFMSGDPRGKRVPEYLAALGSQLVADQRAALEELVVLRDNLEHIKDTVTMQQSYAKLCGVTETVEVADLVEDSLRLNAGAFARHGVALRREFANVPSINVDKHKVLQILVNLVRNAKYACDDSGRSDKTITLRIEAIPSGVRISVIDNGIGIPPANMEKLFQHGFTTRESGHGFGLHSGALAAHELGGSLHAESDGEGLGAAFILELPPTPPARAAR
jgi:PAS domain S-box-containing protein